MYEISLIATIIWKLFYNLPLNINCIIEDVLVEREKSTSLDQCR